MVIFIFKSKFIALLKKKITLIQAVFQLFLYEGMIKSQMDLNWPLRLEFCKGKNLEREIILYNYTLTLIMDINTGTPY